MNKLFRTIGSFVYASIVAIAFLFLAAFVLSKGIVYIHGFWKTSIYVIVISIAFAWLSEVGLKLLSIPFNWLWDETLVERTAAAIPAVLVGLWCLSAPFRIKQSFTTGDWVFVVVWGLCVLFFYVNFFLLPFLSKDIKIRSAK